MMLQRSLTSSMLPLRVRNNQRLVLAKATEVETPAPAPVKTEAPEASPAKADYQAPEWLPEAARPALDFFNAQDVSLNSAIAPITNSEVYDKYLKEYVESEAAKETFGWKQLPESINGRAAMIGFVLGALSEVFSGSSLLQQAADHPQTVLFVILTIIVASYTPVYYGKKGDYMESLQDVYALPRGWFTAPMERIHGRLAMIGLTTMLFTELLTGKALL